jgi:AAA domain
MAVIPNPDGAAALAGWEAERRGSRENFEPSPPWDGKQPDKRQAAYLDKMLRNMHSKLSIMGRDSGRNTAVYNAALKIGNFIAGAGLNEARATAMLLDACNHNGLIKDDGERSVAATIHSGIRNGKTRPRAVPASNGPDDESPEHDMPTDDPYQDESKRSVVITSASKIRPARVRWLWQDRLAVGTLALLAGREGVGKSILAYWLVAAITRGVLPGEHYGQPRAVMVAASEDSWEHTIVPRLIAAGADLDLVYRVEVVTSANVHSEISMPRDLHDLEQRAVEVGAVLLLLDPLMSRLSDRLDTHRDAEVRLALEPLAALANRAHLAVLGIIHHNKSGSTDPLQVVMGSRAFTAVARSVHTVILDPDDETGRRRLFGTPKNNLGRSDLPTFSFAIESFAIQTDDGDLAWTGRLAWGAQSPASIHEAMERAGDSGDQKSAATEAEHWLEDYLTMKGGIDLSAKIKKAAYAAGHTERSLRTARKRLNIGITEADFPRQTWWSLPGTQQQQKGSQS